MLPISTSTLILGSEILSSSGNTLFINGIPLLTGYRFSGYNSADSFISVDNVNYLLSFNRTGTNILQNNVAHSSLTSAVGIVLDDGFNGANAYQYFDKNTSTAPSMYAQIAFNGQPSVPGWVQYQFKTGSYVSQYGINPVITTNGRPPKTWDLSGSFDGSNWVLLDTHANEFPFSDNVETKFSISSPDYYSYYRLVVKAHDSNTYYNAAQIREINFYDSIDRLPFWHEIRFLNSGNGLSVYAGKNETQIILNTLTGANGVTVASNNGNLIIGYTGITGDVNAFHPYVNGSGLLNDWNISGQGGIQVYTSGNNLIFYFVGGGGGGGAISVNGGLAISGVTNFIQSGNLILVQNGNDVYVGSPTGNCITVNSGAPIQGLTNFKGSGAAQVTQNGNDVIIGLPNKATDNIQFGLSGYYLRQSQQFISNNQLSIGAPSSYIIFPLTGSFSNSVLSNSLIDVSIEGGVGGQDVALTIFRDGINVFSGLSTNNGGFIDSNMGTYTINPFTLQYLDTGYTGTNPKYSLGVSCLYSSACIGRRIGDTVYGLPTIINIKEYAYGPQFGINIPVAQTGLSGYYLRQIKYLTFTGTQVISSTSYTPSYLSGQFDINPLSGSFIDISVEVPANVRNGSDAVFTVFRDNVNLLSQTAINGIYIYSPGSDTYGMDVYSLTVMDSGITGNPIYNFQAKEYAGGAFNIGNTAARPTINSPSILILKEYASGAFGTITNVILANSGTNQTPYDYTKLTHTVGSNVSPGTATAGSWFIRNLNTVDISGISGVSLNTSNGEFFIPSGTYDINGFVTALQADTTIGRIFNISLNSQECLGSLAWGRGDGSYSNINSFVNGRVVVPNTGGYYRLEQLVTTTRATYGQGGGYGVGLTGVYALLELRRINPLYQGLILKNSTANGGGTSNFFLNGVTGSGILTGINGVNVTTTGNTITIDYTGAGGTLSFSGSGNLISVNGTLMPSGIIDFQGYGGTVLIPSGNTVFISGGADGGGSSVVYRSYGWYTDQIYSGSTIGPVYRVEMNQNISGFFANTKGFAERNIFMDIKTSPTITGAWTSLFSGVTGQGIPVIPTNQMLSTSGVFSRSVITGNYYLRFDCYSYSTGNGLTVQLSCYY